MATKRVKPGLAESRGLTRRDVLRAAAFASLGGVPAFGSDPESQPAASQPASRASVSPPWWLGPDYPVSRVVEVHSPHVLGEAEADQLALVEMVSMGVREMVGARTAADAWRAILGPARRIVLKFNHVGASVLGTNEALARALRESLDGAGYDPGNIAAVEISEPLPGQMGLRVPESGWGASIPVGDGVDELVAYLYEADALINVPLLKTHQIAGLSGALKNLSHGLIRHPARYHGNHCSPYVGQVVGNKEVSSRLKINIVNAARLVVRNGPDAARADVADCGTLLMAFDPVAVDTVGHELLLAERHRVGLPDGIDVPYLVAAAEWGVGRRAPYELDRKRVRHGA